MSQRFEDRARAAAELLEQIAGDHSTLAELDEDLRRRLLTAAGQAARPGPWAKRELARAARRKRKQQLRDADERRLARTGIREKRAQPVFETPKVGSPPVLAGADIDATLALPGDTGDAEPTGLHEPRTCYVCKADFTDLHHFYDSMCPPCAQLNWDKRHQVADLSGRVALVTGARIKIGYQAAIMLLRSGARVVVTTRFPRDAARRYAGERDFAEFRDRLQIFGLDLRHTPSVELFCRELSGAVERLDFIVNNACQTVRKPIGFYSHLIETERARFDSLAEGERALLTAYEHMRVRGGHELIAGDPTEHGLTLLGDEVGAHDAAIGLSEPAELSQLAIAAEDIATDAAAFPAGQLDADLQQLDLRDRNSWRLPLAEVGAVEMLEVQLVNSVAPFLLNSRLKPLMLRQPSRDKHIVNVSAMEGQFYRSFKTDKHPHTNMAKAALNMMTRTSASDYIKDGIHMNSVDTGWITDEDPHAIAERKRAVHRFHPPLDIVDGAARIVDPILSGISSGEHVWGQFLKDYKPTHW